MGCDVAFPASVLASPGGLCPAGQATGGGPGSRRLVAFGDVGYVRRVGGGIEDRKQAENVRLKTIDRAEAQRFS